MVLFVTVMALVTVHPLFLEITFSPPSMVGVQ